MAGCLSTGENGRFVLTAAPDPGVTTAARAGMGERDTYAYVLTGGSNLQSYLGKRVEVAASGDLAVEYGTWSETGLGPNGTEEDHGRYVTVFLKVNGAWKIAADASLSTKPEVAANPSN